MFDFIIVGAGTAGCVLAARLSEDPKSRVLLLESGSQSLPPAATHPPAWPSLLASPANWGDVSVTQLTTGVSTPLPRGKGLGGSSAINAMVFARGHYSSYEKWRESGITNWGFDDLLPYFMRTESATEGLAKRGAGGPLKVAPAASPNAVLLACLEAAEQSGYRRASDISGGLEEGFAPVDLNIVEGRRQSAAMAYLEPAQSRPNLTVVTDAIVHGLRFSGTRCIGVDYLHDGSIVSADAANEVVLAAGAIGSPQLLLLSGIGPGADLHGIGIDVVADLPGVGENFHDHPRVNLVFRSGREVPPARNNHGEIIGLLRSSAEVPHPDLQIIFIDIAVPNIVGSVEHGFTIGVSPILPKSRGRVWLASTDIGMPAKIDPRYFSADCDMRTTLAGIEIARCIASAPALAPWDIEEVAPSRRVQTEEDLRAYAYATAGSYFHPVGTCALGDGPASVVDATLRVHGIQGLRIADASIIPSIPSANTNATVYAIAERAADLIRS